MDYKKTADEVSKKVFAYLQEDTSEWKVVKSTKTIKVWSKPSEDFSGTLYRAEALVEIPHDKLFPFIYLPEHRGQWDKAVQSYKLVETIDEDTFVFHIITHSYGFGMISPREFVYLVRIKKYDGDLMTTNSVSIDHPDYPLSPNYVRGSSYPSGYACSPLPENPQHTKFVAILQVDLGGMLMPSVIDSVMPTTLINLVTDCKAGLKKLKADI
ncbi:stAR-related lipid transfer protein 6 [Sceloporus undulatus]|uniref:stAR-related lipid transfer protein 6 n=1 Tax=Sceloporus undulatus TaxID=8520 RepID=UPI001C4B9B0A|nr:stAR-related lipid transfer protein 6 [Sceloporus undulatus]